MVEVAEELVEAMHGRKIFVAVSQMVFAKLAGRITEGLQRLGNSDISCLKTYSCARYADLGEACALRRLTGDEA